MVTIWPAFAKDFACKANACRHTCCRGWEIDIDADTAEWYLSLQGTLGDELRQNIAEEAGTYSFRLTADERCPFLRPDGLCRLILGLGEENLCEICTMHPRFFVYCGNFELAGFGLACEKATELLLQADSLCFRAENGTQNLDFLALLQLLGHPVPELWLQMPAELTQADISFLLTQMMATEPIDDDWTGQVKTLQHEQAKLPAFYADCLSRQAETLPMRVTSYLLYRQMDKTEAYDMRTLCLYARLNTVFVYLLSFVTGNLAEALRRWSEQIEYDEENTAQLLAACGKSEYLFLRGKSR